MPTREGFLRETGPDAELAREVDDAVDGDAIDPWERGAPVPARVSFVTLAVRDFAGMASFYRGGHV